MKLVVKQEEDNLTLREYLMNYQISRAMLKTIKLDGDILVNGVHQTVRYVVHYQDEVEVIFPKEKVSLVASKVPLDIYYEDDYYLVINKQPNIPSIPTSRYPCDTLANGILYYYQQHNIDGTVHLVNRLDKETQGLLLVAKIGYYHHVLSKDIKQVQRVYRCLVEGIIEEDGVINKPIYKDGNNMKRIIDSRGKESITKYKVIKHIDGNTLLECQLVTGRTHQIRVHLASINHPLVGDELYGSNQNQEMYLDSISLSFKHPFLNKEIIIKKDLELE